MDKEDDNLLPEYLLSVIDGIGNQKEKNYIKALLSSNRHAADILVSVSDKLNSSSNFEKAIGNLIGAIEHMEKGIDKIDELLNNLRLQNTTIAKESIIDLEENRITETRKLTHYRTELKKIELTYNYSRIKELEEMLFLQNKTKFVVLTEDTNTKSLLAILESNGFYDENTNVFSYHGVNNQMYQNSLKLIRFLSPKSIIIVHRDRDLMTEVELKSWEEDAKNLKFNLFLTRGYDIESYLLDTRHILTLYPDLEEHVVIDILEKCITEGKNASIKKMKNSGKFGDLLACEKVYDSNPDKYSYTKPILNKLLSKLSQHYQMDFDLNQPSEYLAVTVLKNLSQLGLK